MQTDNRFLDDLARLATGAAGAVDALRHEVEGAARAFLERRLADLDLVRREEFEAVKEMAARAREENEALAARLAAVEKELAARRKSPGKKASSRPRKAATRGA
ncbi:MAG: accessory factor UbiK family protein [Rhodothalassiaceae bacterium]